MTVILNATDPYLEHPALTPAVMLYQWRLLNVVRPKSELPPEWIPHGDGTWWRVDEDKLAHVASLSCFFRGRDVCLDIERPYVADAAQPDFDQRLADLAGIAKAFSEHTPEGCRLSAYYLPRLTQRDPLPSDELIKLARSATAYARHVGPHLHAVNPPWYLFPGKESSGHRNNFITTLILRGAGLRVEPVLSLHYQDQPDEWLPEQEIAAYSATIRELGIDRVWLFGRAEPERVVQLAAALEGQN